MKRILATLALLLGALHILSAGPAYPGTIRVTQPDGSVISIRVHGDEWYHYTTDENGQVIARGADGFFRPAEKPSTTVRAQAEQARREARQQRAEAAAKASSLTQGTHRIPVILVEFQDVRFSVDNPQQAFDNLLNQDGYSANGGTGSLHDYYYENSSGAYDPVFEVFGPYLLSKNSEEYVNDAGGALKEACRALDGDVNFSRYDSDRDGYVDMALMYYAGYSPAEGADQSKYIWPHQSSVSGSPSLDGVRLGSYFCTAELRGFSGKNMCGIGPTAHEFGHSLGLPDFYDADYETNGEAGGLYTYSVMCSGSYNNSGRTPPYLNSEEKMLLGWMDGQTEITRQGTLTIGPVQDGIAYKVPTSTDGEYFVLECRNKTGWDSKLSGNGLLVYHVDKSQRRLTIIQTDYYGNQREVTYSAAQLWNSWRSTNAINENGSHPCCYLVPAASQQSLQYSGYESAIPFPGSRKVTTYTPVDWEGVRSDFKFTGITHTGNQVTMTVSYTTTPGFNGRVMNTSAKPVRDATVALYEGSSLKKSTTTLADGTFSFEGADLADATFTVRISCSGYRTSESEVSIGRGVVSQDFYLWKEGESEEAAFIRYDPKAATEAYGVSGISDLAVSMTITAQETTPYAGKQLKAISFQPAAGEASSVEAAYVFVEAGGRRKFTQKVDNLRLGEMNTVNVVAQEYVIPSGTDLIIGYALTGCTASAPVMVQACTSDKMGSYGTYNGTRAVSWNDMSRNGKYYTPVLSANVGEKVQPELGFNHIANPGNGSYRAGARFDLELVRYEDDAPSSVSWTYDGQQVSASSVSLTAGSHTVEAHLVYPDGTKEVIRLVIHAQ